MPRYLNINSSSNDSTSQYGFIIKEGSMFLRKAMWSAAGAGALVALSLAPAFAQGINIAQFDQIGSNVPGDQKWTMNGGVLTYDSSQLVNFDVETGPSNGARFVASLVFTATQTGPADVVALNGYNWADADFTYSMSFTQVGTGKNLLTVFGTGDLAGKLGPVAGHTANFTADNNIVGQSVTYTSALDYGPVTNGLGNNFNIAYSSVNPYLAVNGLGVYANFKAAGAGTFDASPVPEVSSMIAFGGLALSGGLLGFRRRRK
jgi:hypothetical protein